MPSARPRPRLSFLGLLGALSAALVGSACGDRDEVWEDAPSSTTVQGLTDAVVFVDDAAHRLLVVKPLADGAVERRSYPLGERVVATQVSADRRRLVLLTAGEQPRKKADDEKPALFVLEDGVLRSFPLEAPHSAVALDPEGRWIAVSAAPSSGSFGFVENPNEIVLVDLRAPEGGRTVVPRTLRSFGGRPQRVTFTPTLGLPGGPRRLLAVETEQDLALLDLDRAAEEPARPEITVRLTSGSSPVALRPEGLAVDDGDPARSDDARIAVRLANDASVVVLTLGPGAAGAPNDFAPTVNLVGTGGPVNDLAWVTTDVGRRLAATVSSKREVVLVEPATGTTQSIALPEAYGNLSLVTKEVGASGADVALLWGGSSQGVAFFSLGRTGSEPYRSVEVVSTGGSVGSVLAVPAPRAELRLLSAQNGASLFVLDLLRRTASPLTTNGATTLHLAPDGERLWAFAGGSTSLSQVRLADLHPTPVALEIPLGGVFDVERVGGGRALVAASTQGRGAVTVLDAIAPDGVTGRTTDEILLQELP